MQKTAMFYLQNCDLWKLSNLEKNQKQNFSGEHLKDDKQLALPPRRPKHGRVFWTAQHQHGQESVRNWAVRASGADNGHQIWKKRLWLVETSFDELWSAVTADAARATIGSPLYPCQTYFSLSHGNGCHTMLKNRKRHIRTLSEKNKIWKFGWFSASRSP